MMSCRAATRLSLRAIADRANEAELLLLEQHLEGCARCRQEHALLGSVRRLREVEPSGLSDLTMERVRRATRTALEAAPVPTRERGHGWRGLAVGGLLAAGLAILVLARPRPPGQVVSGEVLVAGRSSSRFADGAVLTSDKGGAVLVREASAILGGNTAATWHDAARTLELARGQVTVELPAGRGLHFRVATARFLVEVVGTRFSVDPGGVRVEHGTVRVLSVGEDLLATLHAGESWRVPEAAAASTAAPPAPSAQADIKTSSPLAHPPSHAAPPIATPEPIVAARRALARGEGAAARALVAPLLQGPRRTAVEARALVAESFLVEGRYTEAVSGYQAVVRDYPGTAQAESALFAIAQLQVETGARAAAAETLRRYLAHYPSGRFAREAQRHLDALAPR